MSARPDRLSVVLLTKRNRLGAYLEERLAESTRLEAVVFETRQASWRHRIQHVRRLVRSEGLLPAADIMAYDLYDRVFRARAFRAACDAIIPLKGSEDERRAPAFFFESLNSEAARAQIASSRADVIVVHATGILSQATYALAGQLALNVHCGILPEYRGHASTFWALQRRDHANVGVTIHEIAPKVDTGRILRVGRVDVLEADDDLTAWIKAFALGVDLTIDAIRELESAGRVSVIPPDRAPGPHYRRRRLSDHLRYLRSRRSETGPSRPPP